MRKAKGRKSSKPLSINPLVKAVVRAHIESDINRLRTLAGIHAYTGNDAEKLANLAGRIAFIVCFAAARHGLENTPEASILAGTANALGELAESPEQIERQRGSIVSGLAAIDRLMPLLSVWSLADGQLELQRIIATTNELRTNDVRRALFGDQA